MIDDIYRKVKAKNIRKLKHKDQVALLPEIDREIARFRSAKRGGEGLVSLPTGDGKGINWGAFNNLKKNRAIILTVLTENRSGRGAI